MELRQKEFRSNTNQITQVSKNKKKDVQIYEHLLAYPYLMKTVVLLCFVDSGRSLIDNLKSRHLIVLDE